LALERDDCRTILKLIYGGSGTNLSTLDVFQARRDAQHAALDFRTILKLTHWVPGTNPSAFEGFQARGDAQHAALEKSRESVLEKQRLSEEKRIQFEQVAIPIRV